MAMWSTSWTDAIFAAVAATFRQEDVAAELCNPFGVDESAKTLRSEKLSFRASLMFDLRTSACAS